MEIFELTKKDRELIKHALETLAKSFDDDYYTVGCAVLCSDGSIFTGVNIDCIHGSCAEFVAVGAAVSTGRKDLDTIVAVHNRAKNNLLPPCGNCRQMLFDLCPEVKVILNGEKGEPVKIWVGDLLPLAYKKVPR